MSNEALSVGRTGSVELLPKCGFVCCVGGGQTGSGEKYVWGDVRGGGKPCSDGPHKNPEEEETEVGYSDATLGVVLAVRFDGSVALRFKRGFDTCSGGIHEGAGVVCVKDDVRDGPSLKTDVAAVDGRDEATLTMEDRLDATVEASDGYMIGDGAPGDEISTVATLGAFEGSDLRRLKSGFGTSSVSSRKKSSGRGGSGFS